MKTEIKIKKAFKRGLTIAAVSACMLSVVIPSRMMLG